MEVLWQELTSGLHDSRQLIRVIARLLLATILGAIIGFQREHSGKPAGLRTHMFVCVGSALFVLSCVSAGISNDGLSRVIQGIVTGIGFLGAGSILKIGTEHDIKGLTTAAGVWMTAAIGVTVGLGNLGIAMMAALLTLGIFWLHRFEHKNRKYQTEAETHPEPEEDL